MDLITKLVEKDLINRIKINFKKNKIVIYDNLVSKLRSSFKSKNVVSTLCHWNYYIWIYLDQLRLQAKIVRNMVLSLSKTIQTLPRFFVFGHKDGAFNAFLKLF